MPRDSSPTDRPRLPVPHVEWDGEKFVKATPAPLPAINVHVTLLRSFHEAYLKTSITCNQSAVVLRAFTDTCAQTCVSGVNMLHALNLSQDMVIPTSHQILGVTKRKLNIVGIVLVTVKFNATEWKTPVYISKDVNGFLLSETVQRELGIISRSYPDVNSSCATITTPVDSTVNPVADCGCLRRVAPPPPPEQIPFKPTESNREKLEKWIVDTYAGSAFNKCEHQPTPKLTGAPLDIHWKPDAQPVAVHTPAPSPLHSKARVKQDLDRDTCIEVAEPVPQGVPTEWCSRMLVVMKKDGTPRRVVDYQAVNKARIARIMEQRA